MTDSFLFPILGLRVKSRLDPFIFVQNKVKVKDQYQYLQTIYGVGKILSLTIMLETGPVERFTKVGNYVSYCRKVPSQVDQ